jgi:integrase
MLTVKQVEAARAGTKVCDGNGLYLFVNQKGRSWVVKYTFASRRREMGLGSYPDVGLAAARRAAQSAHAQVAAGVDPIGHRQGEQAEARAAAIPKKTFKTLCDDYIAAHASGWRSGKHHKQWVSTLALAEPKLGRMLPADIMIPDVVDVLKPMWLKTNATAVRLRGRIEKVLQYATVLGMRSGANPAAWAGALSHVLPKPSDVTTKGHFKAMPHKELAEFMAKLKQAEGIGARALEFTILNASRSGEVRGMVWSEVDIEAGLWSIPADRMKAGKAHSVALSAQSIEVLKAQIGSHKTYVFAGLRGKPLSDMTLTAVLRRMNVPFTVHGFRSSFKDWSVELTEYPNEMSELQLAHSVGTKVQQSYLRSLNLDKRRDMMTQWAKYICK